MRGGSSLQNAHTDKILALLFYKKRLERQEENMKKIGRIDWVGVMTVGMWFALGLYMFLKFWRFI